MGLLKFYFVEYWLLRIHGFAMKLNYMERQGIWDCTTSELCKSLLCCSPSDKLGRHNFYGFTKTRFEPWEVAILRLNATTEEPQMIWQSRSPGMLKNCLKQKEVFVAWMNLSALSFKLQDYHVGLCVLYTQFNGILAHCNLIVTSLCGQHHLHLKQAPKIIV